jgi:hypothetical protein
MPAQGIDWADADPALQGVVTEAARMSGPRLTEEEARLYPEAWRSIVADHSRYSDAHPAATITDHRRTR